MQTKVNLNGGPRQEFTLRLEGGGRLNIRFGADNPRSRSDTSAWVLRVEHRIGEKTSLHYRTESDLRDDTFRLPPAAHPSDVTIRVLNSSNGTPADILGQTIPTWSDQWQTTKLNVEWQIDGKRLPATFVWRRGG